MIITFPAGTASNAATIFASVLFGMPVWIFAAIVMQSDLFGPVPLLCFGLASVFVWLVGTDRIRFREASADMPDSAGGEPGASCVAGSSRRSPLWHAGAPRAWGRALRHSR